MRKKRLTTNIALTEGMTVAEAPSDPSAAVRQAVLGLPTQAREVIVLHYFSGLSHDQIAFALGITPAAVHGRLQRARSRLAEILRSTD